MRFSQAFARVATAATFLAIGACGSTEDPQRLTAIAPRTRPSASDVAAAAADPVIVAAGDIVCGTGSPAGDPCQDAQTAALIGTIAPDAVLALGDLQYEVGNLNEFNTKYATTWGAYKSITWPAVGNHEYGTANAAGYFDYFNGVGVQTGRAGNRTKGYYSFNLGAWHLIALNGNCSSIGGCGVGSAQEQWLRADLAANTGAACTVAYWHQARFSSGPHGSDATYQALWQALVDFKADLVLSGHDHDYERFAPQTATGVLDNVNGLRSFVVGTGGKEHYAFSTIRANSLARNETTFGVLKLTLHPTSYDWQFVPIAGSSFTDTGTASCNGLPTNQSPTATITAPANGANFVQGTSVSFAGSGSDPEDGALSGASLVWTSSINGQIGTGTSFSTTTLSVGTHTITLTAKDSQNATGTATRTITITSAGGGNQPPVASFTWTCGSGSRQCTFDASTSTDDVGIVSYAWSWGDGRSETKTVTTTKHTWAANGTYTVTLTVTDGGGLTNTRSQQVTVPTSTGNQSPTATITAPANNASFVQGTSVAFAGTGTDPEDGTLGGASLVWTSSINGQIGTGTSFSTTTLSVGTHTITLTARDSQNATGTATRTITITAPANQAPTATITAPANGASFVQGTSVAFAGTGTDPEDGTLGGASLVWTSSINGQIGTGTSFSTTTLSVGTHTITLTAKDSQNATGTATRTITITAPSGNQPPTASFTAAPTGAVLHQMSFDASGSTDDVGIVSYTWNWGNGRPAETKTVPTARNTYAAAGVYTVTLTVTDAGGLASTISKQVTVP